MCKRDQREEEDAGLQQTPLQGTSCLEGPSPPRPGAAEQQGAGHFDIGALLGSAGAGEADGGEEEGEGLSPRSPQQGSFRPAEADPPSPGPPRAPSSDAIVGCDAEEGPVSSESAGIAITDEIADEVADEIITSAMSLVADSVEHAAAGCADSTGRNSGEPSAEAVQQQLADCAVEAQQLSCCPDGLIDGQQSTEVSTEVACAHVASGDAGNDPKGQGATSDTDTVSFEGAVLGQLLALQEQLRETDTSLASMQQELRSLNDRVKCAEAKENTFQSRCCEIQMLLC